MTCNVTNVDQFFLWKWGITMSVERKALWHFEALQQIASVIPRCKGNWMRRAGNDDVQQYEKLKENCPFYGDIELWIWGISNRNYTLQIT